jgi:hypothetical protein
MTCQPVDRTIRPPFSPDKSESDSNDTLSDAEELEDESSIASGTGWVFNEGLELVLHDVERCRVCKRFAVHYCNAMIYLDPSHPAASLARKVAIAGHVQERIDGQQLQLDSFKKTIPDLQQKLEGIRQELKTARAGLEGHRMKLEEAQRGLEEARCVRAASGSYTESSQRPQSSRSPSPRPHKLQRQASTSSNLHALLD